MQPRVPARVLAVRGDLPTGTRTSHRPNVVGRDDSRARDGDRVSDYRAEMIWGADDRPSEPGRILALKLKIVFPRA